MRARQGAQSTRRQYGFSSNFSYMVLEEFFPLFLEILKNKEQELHEEYLKPIDQGGVVEIINYVIN